MITTLWMFYPCFEWLFYTMAAAASTTFSPQSFSLCSVLVQLAIHFQKLLPQHIYICPAYFVSYNCCTRGRLVQKCTRLHEHQFCPKLYLRDRICTSVPYFLLQVSAFRPTQLRHSLRVKGRFSFKYVFVLTVTSR